jgi:uncharacterized membrane protein
MTDFKGHPSEGRTIGDPRRVAHLLLVIAVLTLGFADYWAYSIAYHQQPDIYQDLLHGTGLAPAQYRVGVLIVGHLMAHGPLGLRHTLTAIDIVTALVGVFALFYLLQSSEAYQRASAVRRWFAAAAFVLLVEFYFAWVLWYQRPETLANFALIALTLLLLTMRLPMAKTSGYLATAALMLALAVLQGFVRADVGFALHVGIFLVCLTRAGDGLSLPRPVQAAISALAVLLTGSIQYYLMEVRYPQARYATSVFQLPTTLATPSEWIAFLLFIVPYMWTLRMALRLRSKLQGPNATLLVGSAVYLVMWLLLGRAKEVRIFFPFALGLAPLTVQLALKEFVPEEAISRPS